MAALDDTAAVLSRPMTPADEPPTAEASPGPEQARSAEAPSSKPDRALAAGADKTEEDPRPAQEAQTLDVVVAFKYGNMKGEYTMRTNQFPADFLERAQTSATAALKVTKFLGTAGEEIARMHGIDNEGGSMFWGEVQTEIRSVTNPSFVGNDPIVCMNVECGDEALEVTLTLNDYVAREHDEVLKKVIDAISEQKGWPPADVRIIAAWQINADGSRYGSPPQRKRESGIGMFLARSLSGFLSPGPDHRVSVSPAPGGRDIESRGSRGSRESRDSRPPSAGSWSG